MIGRTLSHYKILEELSRGGMGIVYRAVDLKLDREVAVKVLPPELVADPERKRRFIQEAKAAAKLEHPHIGVVHEIDEVEGVTFIVMELIRGEQLRDTIAKGPLPLRRTLEIVTEVAEGLARAHDQGIVHRDLKPANIMVTEDGHAKIIDFGLAKLVEPLAGEGSDIETLTRGEPVRRSLGEGGTDPGKIMGTVSYMSPEQARGQKVDHRTDTFSYGVTLYEMLTGELPFHGPSAPETLSAIINAPTPELELSAHKEMAPELQRVIDKCLAKEPAERYQTIKDVLVDLRAVKRQLESGTTKPAAKPRRKMPWGWAVAGAAVAALFIIGFVLLRPSPPPEEAAPTTDVKPSIAVLFFNNMSQDPDLDWLRVGLADMLSTDLAQSPDIQVLTTDRVYQILEEMNRLDAPIVSFDIVKEVAERGNVENVLIGSFMKAEDNIRISVRLQEVKSGDVLTSEHVEGVGEASIFTMADQLTDRVRAELEVPQTAIFRPIEELTTSSPVAYRMYIEGLVLQSREMQTEAIALFDKAVETDPDFAEAHRRLASILWSAGHDTQAERHATLALAQADRLPETERYRLEGRLHSLREEDYGRAIEAYKKVAELGDSPNNLSVRYLFLERYDEAIDVLEKFKITQGGSFLHIQPYTNLGACYIAKGEYEKVHRLYEEMLSKFPSNGPSHHYMGVFYLFWNRLEASMRAFENADNLLPGYSHAQHGRWWVSVLQEDWKRAADEAALLTESGDDRWRWQGQFNRAVLNLYRGQIQRALQSFTSAADIFEEPGLLSAMASSMAGHVLLEKGQFDDSMKHAQRAQKQGKGNSPEWEGLFVEALALAKLGRLEEAENTAVTLLKRTEPIPTQMQKRRHRHLTGELALVQSRATRAIEKLEEAESMLPPRGRSGYIHWNRIGPPPHVPIWFSLASAYLAAGDDDKAAERFQRIIDCGVERIEWPIYYVRSFYSLGNIYENRGEMDKAREYYQRFVDYWKDGDIDRERVDEALSKLRSS